MDVGCGSQQDFVSFLLHFQFSLSFCTNEVFNSERGTAEIIYSSIYMVIPSASTWICPRNLRIESSSEFLLLLLAGFKIRVHVWISHTSLASRKNSYTNAGLRYSTRQWITLQDRNIKCSPPNFWICDFALFWKEKLCEVIVSSQLLVFAADIVQSRSRELSQKFPAAVDAAV